MVKLYQSMIKGMTNESKAYYISLGVKFGELTKAQAGYILYINNV